jgi:hypothetical protein
MNGREFVDVAWQLLNGSDESNWRTATGRAYYALFLESRDALDRWGFVGPRRDQAHMSVRLKFVYAKDDDLRTIGYDLELLGNRRNAADYQIGSPGRFFSNDTDAIQMIDYADRSIGLLDQIDADPVVRASAIQAIRAGSPLPRA